MNNIQIEKVSSKSQTKEFIRFPWRVYKGDPNWVPPLIMDMKDKINKKKHPLFEHAEMDLFLASKDGRTTGRIAALIDHNHNAYHNEKIVFFGLYESFDDLDTARTLLKTAEDWGKARGMEVLRGPVNLSMNDECAFLIDGFDSPPMVMMTYNPPYYIELMDKCGMLKAKDLLAYHISKNHEVKEKVRAIALKTQRESNITIRFVDMKNLKEEAEKIRFIYNQAWEKNWGFVPWTDAEMDHMVKRLKQLADPSLIIMAEHKGEPVGFAFGLPNYNEILQRINGRLTPLAILKFLYYKNRIKTARAVVFGVLKAYRMTGLSYLLYSELEHNAFTDKYEWGETSWQLEDNSAVNRFTESVGCTVYKKYRIYDRKID